MNKITIERDVLERAIEAMNGVHTGEHHGGIEESITALRKALAQPASESGMKVYQAIAENYHKDRAALAQQAPAWWPAVDKILDEYGLQAIEFVADFKSAMAQPQQEPVAEVQVKMTGGNAGIATVIREIYDPLRERLQPGDKLYTSPSAREPLTDAEIADLCVMHKGAVKLVVDYLTEVEKEDGGDSFDTLDAEIPGALRHLKAALCGHDVGGAKP